MAFDINTARPDAGGFDISTARPEPEKKDDSVKGIFDKFRNGDAGLKMLETAGHGATLGFGDEIGAGVNALIDTATGYMADESMGQAYDRRLEASRGRQDEFREESPELYYPAYIAGNIATGAPLSGAGNLIAREAALGAIEGFGSGESGEDRLKGAAIGGGLGAGFSKVGSYFGRPEATGAVKEAANRAEKAAGKSLLTRAQLTGSQSAKTLETSLETVPGMSATKRIKQNFQAELNTKAAKSIGQDATALTADVLEQAKMDISDMYSAATSQGDILVPPKSIASLKSTVETVKKLPSRPDTAVNIGNNLIDELKQGAMTAQRYNELSSDIRGALFKAQKAGDTPNMKALSKINDVLDDSVQKTLGGDALKQFKDARKLYRNFKVLTKGANTINQSTGDVSGKLLFNEMAKGGKGYSVKGELGDLARLSKIPGVGDSGTATRLLIPGLALGAGLTGGLDISGTLLATILGGRGLGEISQRGLMGMSDEAVGTLGGAMQRGLMQDD